MRAETSGCRYLKDILKRVGDKWSVLLIVELADSTRRFNDLKRGIDGISQRMLTSTLRGLERDGLVIRTVFPTVPARVEYTLSPLGQTILKTVAELRDWTEQNGAKIEHARTSFDAREIQPLPRMREPRHYA